jgi:hypothetical protein
MWRTNNGVPEGSKVPENFSSRNPLPPSEASKVPQSHRSSLVFVHLDPIDRGVDAADLGVDTGDACSGDLAGAEEDRVTDTFCTPHSCTSFHVIFLWCHVPSMV